MSSNQSAVDHDEILRELNNEKAKLFIPAFVYVGLLMLLGTCGNFIVLYFYGFKTKWTPSTGFIITLAVFDLISCLVGMPMEIADLRFYFNFKSVVACKTLRVVTHFASIGSGLTLVIIAIDRYRRICKPFERQLNRKHVKVACIVIGVLSAVLCWPAGLFNKVVEVDVDNNRNVFVKGNDCTTSREDNLKTYIFVFNAVYLFAFIVITLTLSILYTFVGRQLYRHKKFRFYVAKQRSKARRIKVKQARNTLPDQSVLQIPEACSPSSAALEEPPDASETVADLREFVTHGMPEVELVRPSSGTTGVSKTITGVVNFTSLANKSKSLKSVTICDPTQNQVYSIESRTNINARPEPGPELKETDEIEQIEQNSEEDSEKRNEPDHRSEDDSDRFSLDKSRPVSVGSFATFSSRPSSATFSHEDGSMYPVLINDDIDNFDETFIQSETGEHEFLDSSHGVMPDSMFESTNQNLGATGEEISRHPIDLTIESEKTSISIPDETAGSVIDLHVETNHHENDPRPLSQIIGDSKASKVASRLKRFRKNTVTPDSSVESSTISSTVTDVTLTSSVASRASTVKRFKRLFKHNWKNGKIDTDTDNIRDLRTKMIDINTIKYTMIMITITVVFVVSFLPYLSLVIWRYYEDDHEANVMSDTELVLFQIGIRSIFLQSSLNPVIYGGFNSKFRAFFYTTFCACCVLKKKRHRKLKKSNDHSDSTSGS